MSAAKHFVLMVLMAAVSGTGACAKERKSNMEIRITLPKQHYILKEAMTATVTVKNAGTSPVAIASLTDSRNRQATYTVTGPSYPQGRTFRYGNGSLGGDAESETLAPGGTLTARLPLQQMIPFPQPGEHRLVARLQAGDGTAESPALVFTVGAPVVTSAAWMLDDGFQGGGAIRALALLGKPGQAGLYMLMANEIRDHSGETRVASLTDAGAVPAEATGAVPLWTNFNRMDSFLIRYGWVGASAVGVVSRFPDHAARMALPPGAVVIQPGLMAAGGEAAILGVLGKELFLLHFPAPGKGEPRMAWHVPAEADVRGARAAIGPQSLGGPYAAVLVTQTSRGAMLTLVTAAGGKPFAPRRVEIPLARVLPHSEPALRIDANGNVTASVVVAQDAGLRRLAIADAIWPAGDAEGKLTLQPAVEPADAPQAAVAAFTVMPGGTRRDWAVLLRDGTLRGSRSPRAEVRPGGTPVLPLQLLSMSQMSYLLVNDTANVFALAPLP